jgi:hypothetical protein
MKITNVNKKTPEMKRYNIWCFWEYISKKAFNTKYHEGTKDKKNFQNKFNPKNVCCLKYITKTVPSKPPRTSDRLAQEATTWFNINSFNHWKIIIILCVKWL